ncbi:hypothetical protein [Ferrovibrio sp.]|uniref:hypothetical protein n=1 Tax=Ferrovibrio sp. TaxID=1917215 RepID=UPI002604B55C|nr:hypothetical protein [Ferrovibrio sp.]
MIRRIGMLVAIGCLMMAGNALAQSKAAAVVEDLSAPVAGIEVFDFLEPGQVITLPAGTRITLGYMQSCLRETITGGKVTVGQQGSAVSGGKVQQEQLKCGGNLQLGQAQAGKSGAMVFRRGPGTGKTPANTPEPSVTLLYTAPAFAVDRPGDLTIERLDQPETVLLYKASGKLFDLAKTGKPLFAGGIYRVALNGKSTIFRIDPGAADGGGPLLLRLVRF